MALYSLSLDSCQQVDRKPSSDHKALMVQKPMVAFKPLTCGRWRVL